MLELISHTLCPYVQRAAIALQEKGVGFTRRYIDLANKPGWFLAISPLGKVPLLRVNDNDVLFESAAIVDYLDETEAPMLHPENAIKRAQHRAWIAFASEVLNDIAGLYNAANEAAFERKVADIDTRFQRLEETLGPGPYFAGSNFSLVDAAFAPVFRYFDVFETAVDLGLFANRPKLSAWRRALAQRPSVRQAVASDFGTELAAFLRRRDSHLARLMAA